MMNNTYRVTPSTQKKADELNIVARLSELAFGDGFLHYGFWPEGLPSTLSLSALGDAQRAFVSKLLSVFPQTANSVLDVGSGTGAIAAYLSKRGYEMTCVCPSERLNQLARAKLPKDSPVYTTTFEAFATERLFDVCLFAESFHYIDLTTALAKSAQLCQQRVVIFDYFRRENAQTKAQDGTRGTHADFLAEVARQQAFSVVSDDDLTANILPTFELLDHLQSQQLAPLAHDILAQMRVRKPLQAWLLEKCLGRHLQQLSRPRARAQTFQASFEYRLIVLDKLHSAQ